MSDMTTDPVELPKPVEHWLHEYKKIQGEIKELQERLDIARAHVELALGESTLGLVNGQPAIKWNWVESRRFDQTKAKELLKGIPGVLERCYTTQRIRRFEVVREGE
jgi:predicted phage-related endonuclease